LFNLRIDTVVTQRQTTQVQVNHLKYYKSFGIYNITDLDDLLWNMPPSNPAYRGVTREYTDCIRTSLKIADKCIASTEPLREELNRFAGVDSIVLPNMLMPSQYSAKIDKSLLKFTVIWAGSPTHIDDMEQIVQVVKQMPDVNFIFFGYIPKSLSNAPNARFVKGVPFDDFNKKLEELCAVSHVAIAPLDNVLFNACKSNLKLIEFGAHNLPVITSDVYPYKDNPCKKITCKHSKQLNQWVSAITEYKNNPDLLLSDSIKSREYADTFNAILPANTDMVLNTLRKS
jgi:glycosyltransferase involved in cell wall biosynthesis